jgi:hypothetical protein
LLLFEFDAGKIDVGGIETAFMVPISTYIAVKKLTHNLK